MEFEGGVIVDRDGKPIWEAKCYTCGIVIEHGSYGQVCTMPHLAVLLTGDISGHNQISLPRDWTVTEPDILTKYC